MRKVSDLTVPFTSNPNLANLRLISMTAIPRPVLISSREYGLMDHFKLNIETNHATLAGHTVEHDLTVAANANALGSIDAKTRETPDWVGYRSVSHGHLHDYSNHAGGLGNGWLHHRRFEF